MKQQLRFGIDMGGTTAKLGVVNPNNKLIWQAQVSSAGDPKPSTLVSAIAEKAIPLLEQYKIKTVGVGVAGDINFEEGIVRISPNLGWKNVPLRKLLSNALKAKVIVDNDANVAAWGIYKTQVSASVKNVIVITLGTGVGGGLIFDGKLYRGATGSAGEIGHMIMDPNGARCNCGNFGCLETYAGGFHIVRQVTTDMKLNKPSQLQKIYSKNKQGITPYDVAKAAQAGDAYAKTIWQDLGRILGRAIGNLIYVYNPQMIFLTGGVAQAGALVLSPMQSTLKERAFKTPIQSCSIKIAKEAPHIGVIGAALL